MNIWQPYLGTGNRSPPFQSARRPRGVGGADHSHHPGTGDDGHSTREGGGEDHSPRTGGPAPEPWDDIRSAGRKLDRDGLSVRKLSLASSDLKDMTLLGKITPNKLSRTKNSEKNVYEWKY